MAVGFVNPEGNVYHRREAVCLIKPQDDMHALPCVMMYQACGLDKKIPLYNREIFCCVRSAKSVEIEERRAKCTRTLR